MTHKNQWRLLPVISNAKRLSCHFLFEYEHDRLMTEGNYQLTTTYISVCSSHKVSKDLQYSILSYRLMILLNTVSMKFFLKNHYTTILYGKAQLGQLFVFHWRTEDEWGWINELQLSCSINKVDSNEEAGALKCHFSGVGWRSLKQLFVEERHW